MCRVSAFILCLGFAAAAWGQSETASPAANRSVQATAAPVDDKRQSRRTRPASDNRPGIARRELAPMPPLLYLNVPVHIERLSPANKSAWLRCFFRANATEGYSNGIAIVKEIELRDGAFAGAVQFTIHTNAFKGGWRPTKPSHLTSYSCVFLACPSKTFNQGSASSPFCSGCWTPKRREEDEYVRLNVHRCYADPSAPFRVQIDDNFQP